MSTIMEAKIKSDRNPLEYMRGEEDAKNGINRRNQSESYKDGNRDKRKKMILGGEHD